MHLLTRLAALGAAALVAVTVPVTAASPVHAVTSPASQDADAPWPSGTPIGRATTPRTPGYYCTAGLPATKAGRHYLVTAGHCTAGQGETIYTAWPARGARRVVGTVTGTSSRYDIAAIRTTRPVAARVRTGTGATPLRGVAGVKTGQSVCQTGATSGRVCGIKVVKTRRAHDGTAVMVYGRVPAGVTAARGGDSGALVLDDRGRAVGIVSATSPDRRWVSWTPARTALATWGLTPVTTR